MADYKGADSTLCAGCGHDAITSQIIKAFYEYGVEPHRVAKLSGIGCSSKTPAYFLSKSHGFNGVHGRMPALGTGVMLANKSLVSIGVSGDGDTASIGMGQFVHLLRRNVPMIYIIENNGVYGLTKGQFSATADLGSKTKSGVMNDLPSIDLALTLRVGGVDEPASKQAISQFTADMLRQGTRKRTADQISELIDTLGGTLSAGAGEESSTVHCGALAKDFTTCLDLLADVALHPSFPEKEMGEIRDRLIASIDGVRDNKDALADQHFDNQFYGDAHPKGMVATKESVR